MESSRPTTSTAGCSRAAPGDGQHVVQRHGQVGDQDLQQGLTHGLGRRGALRVGAYGHTGGGLEGGLALGRLLAALLAQFAPHLPADPQQEQAAGEQQADRP
jgi:hypothetical protein